MNNSKQHVRPPTPPSPNHLPTARPLKQQTKQTDICLANTEKASWDASAVASHDGSAIAHTHTETDAHTKANGWRGCRHLKVTCAFVCSPEVFWYGAGVVVFQTELGSGFKEKYIKKKKNCPGLGSAMETVYNTLRARAPVRCLHWLAS